MFRVVDWFLIILVAVLVSLIGLYIEREDS